MNTSHIALNKPVEHITWNDQHIATIIRRDYMPSETTFISPDSYYQQLGFVVYPKDGVVPRHSHLPLQRHLVGTPETLLIRKGRTEVELYAMDKSPLGTWILEEGDMIQLVAGGHWVVPGAVSIINRPFIYLYLLSSIHGTYRKSYNPRHPAPCDTARQSPPTNLLR